MHFFQYAKQELNHVMDLLLLKYLGTQVGYVIVSYRWHTKKMPIILKPSGVPFTVATFTNMV